MTSFLKLVLVIHILILNLFLSITYEFYPTSSKEAIDLSKNKNFSMEENNYSKNEFSPK